MHDRFESRPEERKCTGIWLLGGDISSMKRYRRTGCGYLKSLRLYAVDGDAKHRERDGMGKPLLVKVWDADWKRASISIDSRLGRIHQV